MKRLLPVYWYYILRLFLCASLYATYVMSHKRASSFNLVQSNPNLLSFLKNLNFTYLNFTENFASS